MSWALSITPAFSAGTHTCSTNTSTVHFCREGGGTEGGKGEGGGREGGVYYQCSPMSQLSNYIHVHVLMRDERRKEERSKQGQTNNKAKQHSTPKAVTCIHVLARPHLVQDELAGVCPAVVSHKEGDGGRRSAVAVDVVEALGEAVCVEVAVLRVLVVEGHAAHHDAGPIISMLCGVYTCF